MVRMTEASRGEREGMIERKLGSGWRARLDALLTRQTELYGELDALCDRQRGLIEAGDTERLMGLLSERARVVQELVESGERFLPFGASWGLIEQSLSESELRDATRRLDAVAALAASIAARDEADGASIRARRDELADQLSGLGQTKRAVSAYGAAAPAGPRYQDRKG